MTKYVLSIDGGGVRGLASATFLSELDKSTNKKLSESFDLIVGTCLLYTSDAADD